MLIALQTSQPDSKAPLPWFSHPVHLIAISLLKKQGCTVRMKLMLKRECVEIFSFRFHGLSLIIYHRIFSQPSSCISDVFQKIDKDFSDFLLPSCLSFDLGKENHKIDVVINNDSICFILFVTKHIYTAFTLWHFMHVVYIQFVPPALSWHCLPLFDWDFQAFACYSWVRFNKRKSFLVLSEENKKDEFSHWIWKTKISNLLFLSVCTVRVWLEMQRNSFFKFKKSAT